MARAARVGAAVLVVVFVGTAAASQPVRAQADHGDFLAALRQATGTRQAGARNRLHGLRPQEVSLPQLLEAALERNLVIKQMAAARRGTAADRIKAEAAFDVALNGAWSYTKTYGYDRGSYVTRERGNTTTIVESETTAEPTCITIDGQVVNFSDPTCTTSLIYGTDYELASLYYDKPPFSWTGSVGADKYLPWGAQVLASVSLTMSHSNSYSIDGLYSALSDGDPYGYGHRFPWTSSAALGLTTPLPFTKYFGDGFQPNWEMELANAADRQSAWSEKSTRISVLQQTVALFWGLVEARQQIEVLNEQIALLEAMAARAKRQFDRQLMTAYDEAQVRASVENARSRLEIAWTNYHRLSAALQVQIADTSPAILVPTGYAGPLAAAIAVPDHDEAVAVARDRNPDIHVSLETMQAADATHGFRQAQTRPDLQLEMSFTASQSSATFGYDDPWRSLSNLVEPDQTDIYVGLRLRVPLNSRAEEAALSRARAERRQATDNARLTQNNVTALVAQTIQELHAAQNLIDFNRAAATLAAANYQQASRLYDHEMATQYDLLLRLEDVVGARLGVTAAAVRARVAQAQLLALQGILDERLDSIAGGRP